MKLDNIDKGKPFDWGRTSSDYARYRDIYPEEFYELLVKRGLCIEGQSVLDIGTGTGVLPRNMYRFGAKWTGADISENQISMARQLAAENEMDISFEAKSAETVSFPENSFDVITACQCYWYFDQKTVMPRFAKMLKKNGKLVLLYMAWLPFEDRIAGESERIVLKYNPDWSGCGETRKPISVPEEAYQYFTLSDREELDMYVRFTRESWHGRMRACRGVGASLTDEALAAWDAEHKAMLGSIAPEEFSVLHYAAITVLEKK